jgi:glycosyltransferase involved in cell wall biosynthesis
VGCEVGRDLSIGISRTIELRSHIHSVHVIASIAEEASGPSYSVVRLCQTLIDEGEVVRLAVLDWAPLVSKLPFLDVFPLGYGPRRLGFSPGMRRWLGATALSGQADIIHNHGLWMMPNVYAGWATRKTKCRLVVSPRGSLSEWALGRSARIKRVFWSLLQGPAFRHAACFHATAETEFEDIRRAGFRQPVSIIPNGIDVPALQLKSGGRRHLLFLGRVHPKKGVDVLLHAWRKVSQRFTDWDLRIAGPDNEGHLPRMQALAADLRLQRVEFCGPLYGEEKLRAYRDAELFILPTHSENFGMTVAEALAAGTPAIVTRGAPWAGLEEHGAGWWIDIGVDPLVACLDGALSRPRDELAAQGIRGREWMRQEFSWERVGAMMDQTYRWLLSGGDAPACVRLD